MPIMQEAIDKEDWERMDKGLPPIPKPKIKMPIPSIPNIENQIKLDDIPIERIEFGGISFCRKAIENKEGYKFMGYEISIILKRKQGRPKEDGKDDKPISGWISEPDFLKLRQLLGNRFDDTKGKF